MNFDTAIPDILAELKQNSDISNADRTTLFTSLTQDESAQKLFWTQIKKDKQYIRQPSDNKFIEEYIMYSKNQVLVSIYRSLRRYIPYDGNVKTELVQMPLSIWDYLFDRITIHSDIRKLPGSKHGKERIIKSYSEFRAIFDTNYPARVWNDKRNAIPKAPIIIYYYEHHGLSGCICKLGFRVYDEHMQELNEMRSLKAGESRLMRNTLALIQKGNKTKIHKQGKAKRNKTLSRSSNPKSKHSRQNTINQPNDTIMTLRDRKEKHNFNDDFCAECLTEGTLICCDSCSAAFHEYCLENPPSSVDDDLWLCPDCSCEENHTEYCVLCNQGGELLCCDGCTNAYHMNCLEVLPRDLNADWFCDICTHKSVTDEMK